MGVSFDSVVINKIREAIHLSRFFKKRFNIKYRFYKGYYKISFDKTDIIKTTFFWDKNTEWRHHHIKTYKANDYIDRCGGQ